ncbi:hypothetical protein [Nonomuraea sp. NPDC049480]|uniref:hypothetical protein n=1 Tax=Nonomuraea sp. NPDC049480 TaxID=3364353 RepID=UPI00378F46F2
MARRQREPIESPGAWLTVASRICLDLLGSARARARRVHPSRCLPLLLRRSGRDRRPYPGGLPPAGLDALIGLLAPDATGSPTAAAWSAPCSTPLKAVSGSRASSSTSPARHPT